MVVVVVVVVVVEVVVVAVVVNSRPFADDIMGISALGDTTTSSLRSLIPSIPLQPLSLILSLHFTIDSILCRSSVVFTMRPQSLWRSLQLLQRVPNRSFAPAGLGRGARTVSSSSRVPDFAFAFEYGILPLLLSSWWLLDSRGLMFA